MMLFRFRTRDPERDRKVDVERLGRLAGAVRGIRAEMERERSGLRDRYERAMAVAAFSQAAEDDDGAPGLASKIESTTDTIIRCTRRLDELDRQIVFATVLGRRTERFLAGSAACLPGRLSPPSARHGPITRSERSSESTGRD